MAVQEPAAKRAKCSLHTLAVGTPVEYFLCGDRQQAKRELEAAKVRCIKLMLSCIKDQRALADFVAPLVALSPVLITGSSGYLGSALVEVLRAHGIACVGIDLIGAKTTEHLGCVSDRAALQRAGAGCKAVIHTAALHAPNLDFYSSEDFERVNVQGTQNMLSVARELGMRGVVFSSTTSLMNTTEVKLRAKSETVVQDASVDYGVPRNIYGVTKKAAEALCLGQENVSVAVLRCSRFFVEDAFDTGKPQADRTLQGNNGNVKANEMLCGTRAALEDMVMAHLVALVRICGAEGLLPCSQKLVGPFIISSVSPLLGSGGADVSVAKDSKLYSAFGWSAPERPERILDSRATWDGLQWRPRWSFERLLNDFQTDAGAAVVRDGLY